MAMKNVVTRPGWVAISVLVIGASTRCGSFSDKLWITYQEARISGCGGFAAEQTPPLLGGPRAYCDAEVLSWEYEPKSAALTLTDSRIPLNCCGEHSMTIEEQDDLYLVTETDSPTAGGSRCKCVCAHDYSLKVEGISVGLIKVKVVRIETDSQKGERVIFEGDLDLSKASGSIVVDPSDGSAFCRG